MDCDHCRVLFESGDFTIFERGSEELWMDSESDWTLCECVCDMPECECEIRHLCGDCTFKLKLLCEELAG